MASTFIRIDGPLMSLELNKDKNKVAVAGRRSKQFLVVFCLSMLHCYYYIFLQLLKYSLLMMGPLLKTWICVVPILSILIIHLPM